MRVSRPRHGNFGVAASGSRRGRLGRPPASTVRDLRVAEVVRQDVVIENGRVSGFRVRLAISFKYESGD